MALVSCPECGKPNVSDSTRSCPKCGYDVKAYYERIEKEKQAQEIAEEKKKTDEEQRKRDIAKYPLPSNDAVDTLQLTIMFLFGCFLIIGGVCSATAAFEPNIGTGALLLLGGVGLIVGSIAIYNKQSAPYKKEMKLLEELGVEKYREYKYNKDVSQYGIPLIPSQRTPTPPPSIKCPICGSINTAKIFIGKKIVSTELFGLASNDIGKQYECKSCGHKF